MNFAAIREILLLINRYMNLRHILFSVAGTFLLSTDVTATSCWIFVSDDPLSEAIQHSDVVFVGEAESVRKVSFQHQNHEEIIEEIQAAFLVQESLKGSIKGKVQVNAAFGEPCQCLYEFEPGEKYLVLASIEGNSYVTKYCRFIRVADKKIASEAKSKIRSGE